VADGAHASGVVGVLPTLTFPSHTTLITGVDPARHGVFNNVTFDPTAINQDGWYWYASDIKVPTLWDAAKARPFHRQCPLAGQRGRGYPLEPAPDLAHGSCR
jgi:predicted AlkP superfamily pyrophosphatase or phosphodiesterase